MLSLEIRKKSGDGEVRRLDAPSITIGASSGNQVVVRARGVAGRHFRILEKEGSYYLDVFKGVEPVFLNGREITSGPIGIGDRIVVGEATLTLLNGRPGTRHTPYDSNEQAAIVPLGAAVAEGSASAAPLSEAEYRGLRLESYRLLKRAPDAAAALSALLRFLADEIGPEEWASGWLQDGADWVPVVSIFRGERPTLGERLLEQCRSAVGPIRFDAGSLPLIVFVAPARPADRRLLLVARETLRLPPRATAFVEEVVQMADLALSAAPIASLGPAEAAPVGRLEEALVVASDIMRRLAMDLPRLARSRAPVLVSGEVGTGKDTFARLLHRESERAAGPLVLFDCEASSHPAEELFGRVSSGPRGERRRQGAIEQASSGTLVLNEIGALPLEVQARLLQVLLRGEVVAQGGDTPTAVNVRWIATTSRNLLAQVEAKEFRRDLYFRLAVLAVRLPSLAEQREAIPALVENFSRRHRPAEPLAFEPDAMDLFLKYGYPGNVRELENEVIRLAAICGPGETVTVERLDPKFRREEMGVVLHDMDDLKKIVESVERQVIDRVMRKVEGNQSQGAELLNISRGSLIAKMREYSIRDYRYLRRERKKA
jgi:DNA-binding NtrC family response regulator